MIWTTKGTKDKGKTADKGTSADWHTNDSTYSRPPWVRYDQPAQQPTQQPVGQGVNRWKIDEAEN